MIALTLPWPPTTNHSHYMNNGRRIVKKPVRDFREKVAEIVAEAGVRAEGRLACFIALYPPSKARRDISNYQKQTEDALMLAGLFDDDEQIDFEAVIRKEVVKGGMAKVVIVPIDDWKVGLDIVVDKDF